MQGTEGILKSKGRAGEIASLTDSKVSLSPNSTALTGTTEILAARVENQTHTIATENASIRVLTGTDCCLADNLFSVTGKTFWITRVISGLTGIVARLTGAISIITGRIIFLTGIIFLKPPQFSTNRHHSTIN